MTQFASKIHAWCERRFGTYTTEGANETAIEAYQRGILDKKLNNPYHPEPYYSDCLKQYRDDWMRGYDEGYNYGDEQPQFL